MANSLDFRQHFNFIEALCEGAFQIGFCTHKFRIAEQIEHRIQRRQTQRVPVVRQSASENFIIVEIDTIRRDEVQLYGNCRVLHFVSTEHEWFAEVPFFIELVDGQVLRVCFRKEIELSEQFLNESYIWRFPMEGIRHKAMVYASSGVLVIIFVCSVQSQEFGGKMDAHQYGMYRVNVFHDTTMQEEIGLTEEQREALQTSFREKMGRLNALLALERQRYGDDEMEVFLKFRDSQRIRVYEELTNDLSNTLLPFQAKRLDQMTFWMAMERGGGFSRALLSDHIVKELGIDEVQAKKLADELKALDREFKKKLADLKSEYRDKAVDLLDPDQQQRLRELIGANVSDNDD